MKLIFAEEGSALAIELWDRADTIVSSQLIYPEARAAAAAARRGGRIDARALRQSVATIGELYAELHVIGVDRQLALEAGALAEHYGLRGYDAVHLASANAFAASQLIVATWDDALSSAARRCGHVVPRD